MGRRAGKRSALVTLACLAVLGCALAVQGCGEAHQSGEHCDAGTSREVVRVGEECALCYDRPCSSAEECSGSWGIRLCDPRCGEGGACRACVSDDDCTDALGPGFTCSLHCGTCCRPDAPVDDPAYCNCI